MRTVILEPAGGLRLVERPLPVFSPDEALLRVLVCGVCTSDMGVYRAGLGEETVLGHEVVGVVEALGENVRGLYIGQRVTGAIVRGFAEYSVASAAHLIPVPDSLADSAAIVEPFSCLLSGIRRSGCRESALVVGAGFMGLALIATLRSLGVRRIGVCDLRAEALALAKEIGADAIYVPPDAPPECAHVFEVTGTQSGLTRAGEWAAREGTLTVVGYHPCVREIDMGLWAGKALTVVNAFEYDRSRQLSHMRDILGKVAGGGIPLERLLTHEFSLEETDQAFQTHLRHPDGFVKGYIRISRQ